MSAAFRIETLSAKHERKDFSCGNDVLDRYFAERVSQDIRRRITACYVALESETGSIAGFYTLSAADIPLTDIPKSFAKRLPRYPSVPVARLGRLAVDRRFQGRGIGGALLWDALKRSSRSEIAVFALVVDAKDDEAEAFYQHYGFVPLGAMPRQWVLPLSQISFVK